MIDSEPRLVTGGALGIPFFQGWTALCGAVWVRFGGPAEEKAGQWQTALELFCGASMKLQPNLHAS